MTETGAGPDPSNMLVVTGADCRSVLENKGATIGKACFLGKSFHGMLTKQYECAKGLKMWIPLVSTIPFFAQVVTYDVWKSMFTTALFTRQKYWNQANFPRMRN